MFKKSLATWVVAGLLALPAGSLFATPVHHPIHKTHHRAVLASAKVRHHRVIRHKHGKHALAVRTHRHHRVVAIAHRVRHLAQPVLAAPVPANIPTIDGIHT